MATDDTRKLCADCEARMAVAAATGKLGILLCARCAGDTVADQTTATLDGAQITPFSEFSFHPSEHEDPRPN